MNNIAVVGCGLVGCSWSSVFARAGFDVKLYDPSPASVEAALSFAKTAAAALAAQDLLNGKSAEVVLARLKPVQTLADAVRDADYIQESAPERLPIKQALYKEMAPLVKADAVIASSTSGLPALPSPRIFLGVNAAWVSHPINPPHRVPLVELVPAPWTAPNCRSYGSFHETGRSGPDPA